MQYGMQLFGANALFCQDPHLFCKTVKDLGYHYLETCFYLGDGQPEFPALWSEAQFQSYRAIWESYGLSCCSAHIFTDNIDTLADKLVALAQKYNIKQFVMNCPEPVDQSVYLEFAQRYMAIGKQLHAVGAQFLLHNVGPESSTHWDGICAYEWLLNQCDDSVGAQPDTGWLLWGNVDPMGFLTRQANKIHAIHYKDMIPASSGDGFTETEVGAGILDLKACFDYACEKDLIHIVDMDSAEDFFGAFERIRTRLGK